MSSGHIAIMRTATNREPPRPRRSSPRNTTPVAHVTLARTDPPPHAAFERPRATSERDTAGSSTFAITPPPHPCRLLPGGESRTDDHPARQRLLARRLLAPRRRGVASRRHCDGALLGVSRGQSDSPGRRARTPEATIRTPRPLRGARLLPAESSHAANEELVAEAVRKRSCFGAPGRQIAAPQHGYRIVLHRSSNRCHGTDLVGSPPGCPGAISDRPRRARSAKRAG